MRETPKQKHLTYRTWGEYLLKLHEPRQRRRHFTIGFMASVRLLRASVLHIFPYLFALATLSLLLGECFCNSMESFNVSQPHDREIYTLMTEHIAVELFWRWRVCVSKKSVITRGIHNNDTRIVFVGSRKNCLFWCLHRTIIPTEDGIEESQ